MNLKLKENNLLDAVNELREKGYRDEYVLKKSHLESVKTGSTLKHGEFDVEKGFQFDIIEDAADTQFLFIVKENKTGKKGLVIDLLGDKYYSDEPIAKALQVPLETYLSDNEPELKYGLKKVFKSDFNENPERYELRIGYPDFPECPFGNSFSMLGYDKYKKAYVWLVTSIIRDERLKREQYKN